MMKKGSQGSFERSGERSGEKYGDKYNEKYSDKYSDRGSRDSSSRDGFRGDGPRGRSMGRDKTVDIVVEYKDPLSMTRFISDGGKITPARVSKLTIAQQKKVASSVKKARNLGLLPLGTIAFDGFSRSEQVVPVPFEI